MKHFFLLLATLFSLNGTTQIVVDFETFLTEQDTFLNGSDGSMGFRSPNDVLFLENTFTDVPGGGFWSGWAISTMTDVVTPGFLNQYSSISGSGFDGSDNYAVAYIDTKIEINNQGEQALGYGFYANNSTYAYLSMRDGDAFAKKFGGATGDDPDYFYLSIKKYPQGLVADSTIFYLADFRSSDNTEDYILDEWTFVDLSAYQNADYFTVEFHSSDVGGFGINTPTYFCMDNFILEDVSSNVAVSKERSFKVLPNPTTNYISLEGFATDDLFEIYNANAQLVMKGDLQESNIDVSLLSAQVYFVSVLSEGKRFTKRFVKN